MSSLWISVRYVNSGQKHTLSTYLHSRVSWIKYRFLLSFFGFSVSWRSAFFRSLGVWARQIISLRSSTFIPSPVSDRRSTFSECSLFQNWTKALPENKKAQNSTKQIHINTHGMSGIMMRTDQGVLDRSEFSKVFFQRFVCCRKWQISVKYVNKIFWAINDMILGNEATN